MRNRKITVTNSCYIAPLGQDGPVVNPINADTGIITKLVTAGYNVFEHNITNFNEKIKLNYQNMKNEYNFNKAGIPTNVAAKNVDNPTVSLGDKPDSHVTQVNIPVSEENPVVDTQAQKLNDNNFNNQKNNEFNKKNNQFNNGKKN